jgi:hypothetical protein
LHLATKQQPVAPRKTFLASIKAVTSVHCPILTLNWSKFLAVLAEGGAKLVSSNARDLGPLLQHHSMFMSNDSSISRAVTVHSTCCQLASHAVQKLFVDARMHAHAK